MNEEKQIQLIVDDPWLSPYEYELNERLNRFTDKVNDIKQHAGSLEEFANGHLFFGLHFDKKDKGWYYREWAPAAKALSLIGDFNDWNPESHQLTRKENGVWEVFISDEKKKVLKHKSKIKVRVTADNNQISDRIPLYIKRVIQDPKTHDFAGQVWHEKKFKWEDKDFDLSKVDQPFIYECHTGMALEKEGVGSYKEFADEILPRIKKLGYNTIQLMAVQEHPYYGSFGYHVSNFFAPSSRFGDPEDLKYLINEAHKEGLAVIMDIVHSHAVKNLAEGINEFDGSDYQFFHSGPKGDHPLWDSKVFNYSKDEVVQFLLSNVKYWLDEFHFDGFRFDGITSMLYEHHGHGLDFDHYDKYFKHQIDKDAITYLQLASTLAKEIKPNSILIAEDMSGMPGMGRPIKDGGLGFDYRLAMGVPDFWIKTLKEKSDEQWNMQEVFYTLLNRRAGEKVIAYAESHDQALVGDKSLAFWLMDKEMYYHMQVGDDNLVVDRGIALHKMIRLITASLAGEGYLTFIGNEFGHPEWVDFPREGNDWSYKYARRQWSLVDNKDLKYKFLNKFDMDMVKLLKKEKSLTEPVEELNIDNNNKVIIFKKGKLVFLFNFNVSYSIPDYKFYIPQKGNYKLALNSDSGKYGGFNRVDEKATYKSFDEDMTQKLSVYLPNRTCLVLKKGK